MIILTVNAGSSTVKLDLFLMEKNDPQRLHSAQFEYNQISPESILNKFLCDHQISTVAAITHRIVHGGEVVTEASLMDTDLEAAFEKLITLAPLHNANALRLIKACRYVLGTKCLQIAVPDTGFYRELPAVAKYYALPYKINQQYGIRRFGFHGLAHQSMWNSWCQQDEKNKEGRVISVQLGSGCSVTAIKSGIALDTSMGFTPMEGLVMSTRCGDIDPGIITFLLISVGISPAKIERLLNNESGLLGLSGASADMRELLQSNDPQATLAIELYCYRVKKYIAAYMAVLGGVDAILFGGGVGENAPAIRHQILSDMQWCGITLNDSINHSVQGVLTAIHDGQSQVQIWVAPVDEAILLAQSALRVLENCPTVEIV